MKYETRRFFLPPQHLTTVQKHKSGTLKKGGEGEERVITAEIIQINNALKNSPVCLALPLLPWPFLKDGWVHGRDAGTVYKFLIHGVTRTIHWESTAETAVTKGVLFSHKQFQVDRFGDKSLQHQATAPFSRVVL